MSNKNINLKKKVKSPLRFVQVLLIVVFSLSFVSAVDFNTGDMINTSISNTTIYFEDHAVATEPVIINDSYIYFPSLTYTIGDRTFRCVERNFTEENRNYNLSSLNCPLTRADGGGPFLPSNETEVPSNSSILGFLKNTFPSVFDNPSNLKIIGAIILVIVFISWAFKRRKK